MSETKKITSKIVIDDRFEYSYQKIEKKNLKENPFDQFKDWLNNALEKKVLEPNAMVLSTVDQDFMPKSRVLLLRETNKYGLIFYTNYESDKGKQLSINNKASLNFFWKELSQQIRIEGNVKKINSEKSDLYFSKRPRGSQIGAWASNQSKEISNRKELEDKVSFYEKKYSNKEVKRPKHWGGYILIPTKFEFWQGRENRLHDRIIYNFIKNKWDKVRISP